MSLIGLKRRLSRLEKRHQPMSTALPPDMSKLNESEITFLNVIHARTPLVDGKIDLTRLTDEELNFLEGIIIKLDG